MANISMAQRAFSEIESRFTASKMAEELPGYLMGAKKALQQLETIQLKVSQDRNLSDIGRFQRAQALVQKGLPGNAPGSSVLDYLGRAGMASESIAVGILDLENRLEPKFDSNDVVAAMRRAELRAFLRDADPGERLQLTLMERAFFEAVLEQPAVLSGIKNLDDFRARAFERFYPEEHAEIQATKASLVAFDSALKVALEATREVVGLNPAEFKTLLASDAARTLEPVVGRVSEAV